MTDYSGIVFVCVCVLQDGTVVAELTVQIPSVRSYNVFSMLVVELSWAVPNHIICYTCTLQMDCACAWLIHYAVLILNCMYTCIMTLHSIYFTYFLVSCRIWHSVPHIKHGLSLTVI